MKKLNLIKNGAILAAIIALLSKAVAALGKIPLSGVLGAEGSGLYQAAFPLFGFFVTLCSGGITPAVSAKIAELKKNGILISKKTLAYFAVVLSLISLIPAIALAALSSPVAHAQNQPHAAPLYLALAPAVVICPLSALMRGFFEGNGNFTSSAFAALIAQAVKAIASLVLAAIFAKKSLTLAALAAALSVTLSELTSALYCYLKFRKKALPDTPSNNALVLQTLKSALAVTIGSIAAPAAAFIESILVLNLLPHDCAAALYGLKEGAVGSINALPVALFAALSAYFLPSLAKDSQTLPSKCLALMLSVGCFCSFGLSAFSDEIITILYPSLSPDLAHTATTLLALSAIATLTASVWYASLTILRALKKWWLTALFSALSALVKIPLAALLLPSLGIIGATLSGIIATLALALFGIISLRKFRVPLSLKTLATPLFPVTVFIISALALKPFLIPLGALFGSALTCALAALTSALTCLILTKSAKRKTRSRN